MSRWGLEWTYRLWHDPRRMAQRYLVRDRAIAGIAWRMLRAPRGSLVSEVDGPASSTR
jgi:UDP-N-acetyl-D-mannosaminuronic acid transferase (WecB/TagA/CpsF family)